MMNPKMLMQMKSLLTKFRQNHPKVPMFFSAASRAINEGSVIEISLTTAEGKRTLHQYACDPGRSGNGADSGGDGIEVSIY